MSSSIIPYLNFVNQKFNIYVGFTILAAGTIGGILNILVFLSLRTFRQSSCGFYLTIMSIVNIGQLYTGLFFRVLISGYGTDWTTTSLFYCKFRVLFFQFCTLISYTSLILATIDQYFATCARPDWQQRCNIKYAQRLTLGFTFIWLLHSIPYAILFVHVESPTTGMTTCTITNIMFLRYRIYFVGIVLNGLLPVFITVIFGLLAFRNVRQLAHRAVPVVRRELDRQLTTMVLVQVLVNFLTNIPSVITNAIISNPSITNDAVVWAKLQFANGITLIFFYSYFAVSVKRVLINNVLSDYLEFILHLYLCIGTISSTINLCFNQNTYSTMETTNSSNDK